MPVRSASAELTRRLIEVLRADGTITALLYPTWAPPQKNDNDTRVYNAHVAIDDPELLQILPRIIVECVEDPFDAEQDDVWHSSSVDVRFHSVVPKDQYDHADVINSRIRTIIDSTYLTNSRIIASKLTVVGRPRSTVETGFYDALRLTSTFNAPNVGVLA